MQDLDALKSEIIARIDGADTLDALDALRVSELGKKGRVSLMMRELGGMDPDARKAAGQALNLVKDSIAAAIEARQAELSRAALDARLAAEAVDVSLPSRPRARWQADVHRFGGKARIQRGTRQFCLAGLDRSGNTVLDQIQRLPGGLARVRVHPAKFAHHQRYPAFLAKFAYPQRVQRVQRVRTVNTGDDFRFQRVQILHGPVPAVPKDKGCCPVPAAVSRLPRSEQQP